MKSVKIRKITVIKIKLLNKKGKYQLTESFVPFPLISNPGAGTFDRGFFSVSVSPQDWYIGLCDDGCCISLLDSFVGRQLRVFEPHVFLV
jgi:hypothetical protein